MTLKLTHESRTIYQNSVTSPLGQVLVAGVISEKKSASSVKNRILGHYALVYILDGCGEYSDANGHRMSVAQSDFILVFPELAHSYGPRPGDQWSELYVVFDGAIFDLARNSGVITSEAPVLAVDPTTDWLGQLLDLLVSRPRLCNSQAAQAASDACLLLAKITAMVGHRSQDEEYGVMDKTMRKCAELLGGDLGSVVSAEDVAEKMNLSYESFRKRFQKAYGLPPSRYRLKKRLDAACSLILNTSLSNAQIAESLGFCDAFHFSREFKKHTELSPTAYRKAKHKAPEIRHML